MSAVQSIERAFAVLRALSLGPAGVTEIADEVGLPKSTVSRILATLQGEGAVVQDEAGGDYGLGPALVVLAAAADPGENLVVAATPHVEHLMKATGETAGLGVRDGSHVLYVAEASSDTDVTMRDWTGLWAPLHAVPSGLAILAHLADAELDSLLTGPLEQLTAATVTDPALIRNRLAEIRDEGVVWVRGEFRPDIVSVAAPVWADGAVVAAIHVHGPSYRFPEPGTENDIADLVIDGATRLSHLLDDLVIGDRNRA